MHGKADIFEIDRIRFLNTGVNILDPNRAAGGAVGLPQFGSVMTIIRPKE